MRTVWKFPLPSVVPALTALDMPEGAQVLRCDFDMAGALCLWATVDTEAPTEKRRFQSIGTGHELPAHAAYIASYNSGRWVWHVFEILAEPLPETLPGMEPEQERAYRTLVSDGWVFVGGRWIRPTDEPLTHEQVMAIGELRPVGMARVPGA